MNQVADILDLAQKAEEQNVDAVLATVVRTEGSAYRHAGAMMLICADGRSVGMISGGCLEPHIIKRAFWLTRDGANVQAYQTGDDIDYNEDGKSDAGVVSADNDKYEDDFLDEALDGELNFGLGCNGRVHVLFERLSTATPLLDLIRQTRQTQQPATIATLVKSDSTHSKNSHHKTSQLQIGTRINIDAFCDTGQLSTIDGKQTFSDLDNTFINRTFTHAVKELSVHKFHKKNADYIIIGSVLEKILKDEVEQEPVAEMAQTEWLIQRIIPQVRLLICGAGNDVMPLVTMAKLQDWHVTVIDSRPQYATRMRFPQADVVKCLALEDSETLTKLSANAVVAVMSHSLTQDRARLAVLLQQHPVYLGQLGPRYRTERLMDEIRATIANPALLDEGITKLHYPIGYKLGGDGPEALALGILAQMSAVIHGQNSQAIATENKPSLPVSKPPTSIEQTVEPKHVNAYTTGHIRGYVHD